MLFCCNFCYTPPNLESTGIQTSYMHIYRASVALLKQICSVAVFHNMHVISEVVRL